MKQNIKFLTLGATMALTLISAGMSSAHADEFNQTQQTSEQRIQTENNANQAKELLGNLSSFFKKGTELVKGSINSAAKMVQEKTENTALVNFSETKIEAPEALKSLVSDKSDGLEQKLNSMGNSISSGIMGRMEKIREAAKAANANNNGNSITTNMAP